MNTLTVRNHFNKIAVLGALTIAPALALTSTAQAAPRNNYPVSIHQQDNDHRQNDNRGGDNRDNGNRANDNRQNGDRDNDHRQNDTQYNRYNFRPVPVKNDRGRYDNDHHYDNNRNDNRYDSRYDNDRRDDRDRYENAHRTDRDRNNTGNLLGAGLIGAVIGAVLSH